MSLVCRDDAVNSVLRGTDGSWDRCEWEVQYMVTPGGSNLP